MSSQAQIAANRGNGRKSRGPRTAAGKTRASRNALRYGFGAISRRDPAYFPEIERIARSYCEGDTDPLLFIETLPLAETRDYIKRVMTNMWMYRRRLGQATTGLDDAAAGAWPTYTQTDTVPAR